MSAGEIMNSTKHERVQELEDYCSPLNGLLSLEGLREKMGCMAPISQTALGCSHFLHELCLHPNVTLEMVDSVLQYSPYAAYFCTNRYHGREVDEDQIRDYGGTENYKGNNRPYSGQFISDRSYPIHVACASSNCPGAIVRLLAESNQSALGHFCLLEGGCRPGCRPFPDCENDDGIPIQYYLARSSNVDLDTVKCLVEAYPRCLGEDGCKSPDWYHSIHVLMENTTIVENLDILRYLVKKHPAILRLKTSDYLLPIHKALENEHVTAAVVKFLIKAWPDSVFHWDNMDELAIHKLCKTPRESDAGKLEILKILIEANPESVRIPDPRGEYLLHLAARCQLPDFLKILVDAYPESVKKRDKDMKLAFHLACERGHAETVKYLHEVYPDSINVRDCYGVGPIHFATIRSNDPALEVLKFLLDLDLEGASRAARPSLNGDAQMWRLGDPERECRLHYHNLFLPLHYAAEDKHLETASMEAIQYLFDLFPEALLLKTNSSRPNVPPTYGWEMGNWALTPKDLAQKSGHTAASTFFRQQIEALAIDRDTPFPLHHAIQDDQTLGVVKLLATKWYKDQVSRYDAKKCSPLHYACERGRIDVVNFLLEMQPMSGLEQNSRGKYPIELFLEAPKFSNRDGVEHIEAIWRLLVANPAAFQVDKNNV